VKWFKETRIVFSATGWSSVSFVTMTHSVRAYHGVWDAGCMGGADVDVLFSLGSWIAFFLAWADLTSFMSMTSEDEETDTD
jgi:hypothetical protein